MPLPDDTAQIDQRVVIAARPEALFTFCRHFENLPRFLEHLESVRVVDDVRSHWVAKCPSGRRVEWDARITDELENEMISWESVVPSDVPHTGAVRFRPAGGGTEVTVTLRYRRPRGRFAAALARLFGADPAATIARDLRKLKTLLETPEKLPKPEPEMARQREPHTGPGPKDLF